jgi:CBS domain-containing protein
MAEDVSQLTRIYKRVPVLVKALTESGDRSGNINRIITSVADAMHRQVVGFAMEQIGLAPCRFAFMVMGSEGRGEQTLATDQDNAFVYEDLKENSDEVQGYFLKLGEHVNRDLHTIGYHYCRGEVMARNPKWTQPLEGWKKYFSQWINTSNPQDILEAAIFFDFRYIHGDEQLVKELRDHVNTVSENKPVFYYHMAQSVLKFKPPLNVFGKIVGRESGADTLHLDIKMAMMPVLTFIRLYAIREKLVQTNSMERLNALLERKSIDTTSYEELVQAYDLMMHLRLKFQVGRISANEPPDNLIDMNRLTRMEVSMLKKIFSQISSLQSKVSFDFKG